MTTDKKCVEALLAAVEPVPMPEAKNEDARIAVHAAVGRASAIYEKIRNAIDYRDDHLVRKAAIARILKRWALFDQNARSLSLRLIRELIAAGYLPNRTLPESFVEEFVPIVQKYLVIRGCDQGGLAHDEWLLAVTAAEIEERVGDRGQGRRMAAFLYDRLHDRITVRGELDETTRQLQVYLACHRTLFKADEEWLGYRLLCVYFSAWMRPEEWLHDPMTMASHMVKVRVDISQQINHSLATKFQNAVKPWGVALGIVREVLESQPALHKDVSETGTVFRTAIGKVADKRYEAAKTRLKRGTRRSIIYLFMSKMLLALALEVPFERYFYHTVHQTSLLINILFPPVLMWLVGMFIRVPGKENTTRIQDAVMELVSDEGPSGREVKILRQRRGLAKLGFGITYLITFVLSFGVISYGLHVLQFTWMSSLIFLFFLCVVSFFAYRLRLGAREYVVLRDKESLKAAVADLFLLPILRAGRYLSIQVSRINVLVLIFDFIVEAPFKTVLNVFEEWLAFLKDKKEEIQ